MKADTFLLPSVRATSIGIGTRDAGKKVGVASFRPTKMARFCAGFLGISALVCGKHDHLRRALPRNRPAFDGLNPFFGQTLG